MRIIFVKEYIDINSMTPVPTPPIEIGQRGMLLDEAEGIIELTEGEMKGIRLESVPTSAYGFEE